MKRVLAGLCTAAVMVATTDAGAASHTHPTKKEESKTQVWAPKGGGVFYSFIVPDSWTKKKDFQKRLKQQMAFRLKHEKHKPKSG